MEVREVKEVKETWDLARLEEVIKNQKNNIAIINGVPEITRPIALELYNQIRLQAIKSGLSLKEKTEVLYKDSESVIIEFKIAVHLAKDEEGKPIPEDKQPLLYEISEIGEAHRSEKGKEFTFIRTAYTRAMKRAMERLIGEDFINKVVLSLVKREPKKITEKQIEFIKKLLQKRGIPESKLPKPLETFTQEEASRLIEKLKAF